MNTDNMLWQCKSSSRKQTIMLFSCLALTVAFFVGVAMSSKKSQFVLTAVFFVLAFLPWVVLIILIKQSSLKWETDGLVFTVTENGIYATSPNNYRFSLFAEWAKIVGYSIKQGKRGKANVIVNFSCSINGGMLGNVNFLKMAGVMGADELYSVFEKFGIKNLDLSKN